MKKVHTGNKNLNVSKEENIWADGCYDLVHFGHANSLRQAKLFGKKLTVGVVFGSDIAKHKGPPVFTDEERVEMVASIKWVDDVVLGSRYVTHLEDMDVFDCHYCAHGDDLTLDVDGKDCYRLVKENGRYKEFKRTAGVSTTDIVGRMLLATKPEKNSEHLQAAKNNFIATSQKIKLFSDSREMSDNDTVIYVSGAFDVFHNGHLSFLKECSKLGTFLIVGVHSDEVVESYSKQPNLPIMGVVERTLSLLACKYVNDVVIGAPIGVNDELIKQFKIQYVCHGKRAPNVFVDEHGNDPYALAKKLGLFREIDSGSDLSTSVIIERIVQNRNFYMERNQKKLEKEAKVQKIWEQGRIEHGIGFTEGFSDSKNRVG